MNATRNPDRTVDVATLEQLSALVDGELAPESASELIRRCSKQPELLDEWLLMQQLSDSIRSGDSYAHTQDQAFLGKFAERLAQQPIHLQPKAKVSRSEQAWRIAASVAGVTLVLALVWQQTNKVGEETSNQANLQAALADASADTDVEEYLNAHRQVATSPAWTGAIRQATFVTSR